MSSLVRSTLNPNAPLFIPAAYRQVEDFSPEWWELVNTTAWFRDHWFSQHHEQENFDVCDDDVDVANLLPDSFDFGAGDDLSSLGSLDEAAFHEAFHVIEQQPFSAAGLNMDNNIKHGEIDAVTLLRSLSLKSPRNGTAASAKPALEPIKYHEKPLQYVSPKPSPRRIIQQPR